jgi:hypothetical protein
MSIFSTLYQQKMAIVSNISSHIVYSIGYLVLGSLGTLIFLYVLLVGLSKELKGKIFGIDRNTVIAVIGMLGFYGSPTVCGMFLLYHLYHILYGCYLYWRITNTIETVLLYLN